MANSKRVTAGASSKDKFIIGGIFVALILGSIVGVYLPETAVKFEFLGSLFFNALYMIIVPLIAASMVVGITALGDVRKLGKTARHAVLYFTATSAIAVVIGIVLAATIRPGETGSRANNQPASVNSQYVIGSIGSLQAKSGEAITTLIIAPDRRVARSVSAENLPSGATIVDNSDGSARFNWRPSASDIGSFQMSFFVNDATRGVVSETINITVSDSKSMGVMGMLARIGDAMQHMLNEMIPRNIISAAAETKVLALIVFSLLFGGALSSLGARAKPVVQFFEVINDTIMKIVHLVMYLAPLGVFGIVASKVGDKAGDIAGAAAGIGMFSLVVLIGLAIHTGILMGVLRWLADRNPFTFMGNMSQALGTALGVSSSSATLPVTMECVVEKNNVDQRAASFVLPLGTTINMDGTAMYQAISAIFVCQMFNVPLGLEHYVIMLVTAVLASVGTPGLPQAGIVMMSIVMGSVGVSAEIIAQGVGIILVVDWALDRARTALNVFGDSVGAAVIANTFEFKTAGPARSRTAQSGRGEDRNKRDSRDSRGSRDRRDTRSSSSTRSSKTDRPDRSSRQGSKSTSGRGSERPERAERTERKERPSRQRSSVSSSPEETRQVFAGMVSVPKFDLSRIPEGVYRRREETPSSSSAPSSDSFSDAAPKAPERVTSFALENGSVENDTMKIETPKFTTSEPAPQPETSEPVTSEPETTSEEEFETGFEEAVDPVEASDSDEQTETPESDDSDGYDDSDDEPEEETTDSPKPTFGRSRKRS